MEQEKHDLLEDIHMSAQDAVLTFKTLNDEMARMLDLVSFVRFGGSFATILPQGTCMHDHSIK